MAAAMLTGDARDRCLSAVRARERLAAILANLRAFDGDDLRAAAVRTHFGVRVRDRVSALLLFCGCLLKVLDDAEHHRSAQRMLRETVCPPVVGMPVFFVVVGV